MKRIASFSKWLAQKTSLSEKNIKWSMIGILLLVVSAFGYNISEIRIYSNYHDMYLRVYRFLEVPSFFLGIFGLIALFPVILYFFKKLIKRLWKIIKLVIYEIIFEATRAIQDGKKRNLKKRMTHD